MVLSVCLLLLLFFNHGTSISALDLVELFKPVLCNNTNFVVQIVTSVILTDSFLVGCVSPKIAPRKDGTRFISWHHWAWATFTLVSLLELLESSVMDATRFTFSLRIVIKFLVEPVTHTLAKCVYSGSGRAFRFLVTNAFIITAWIVCFCISSEFDCFALRRGNSLRTFAMLTNICSASLGKGIIISCCILWGHWSLFTSC